VLKNHIFGDTELKITYGISLLFTQNGTVIDLTNRRNMVKLIEIYSVMIIPYDYYLLGEN